MLFIFHGNCMNGINNMGGTNYLYTLRHLNATRFVSFGGVMSHIQRVLLHPGTCLVRPWVHLPWKEEDADDRAGFMDSRGEEGGDMADLEGPTEGHALYILGFMYLGRKRMLVTVTEWASWMAEGRKVGMWQTWKGQLKDQKEALHVDTHECPRTSIMHGALQIGLCARWGFCCMSWSWKGRL